MTKVLEITYLDLAKKIKSGDKSALETLYKELHQDIYFYAFSCLRDEELAKDVVHNIFLKLWEGREKLGEIKSLKNYVFKMTKNHIFDHLRKLTFRITQEKEIQILTKSSHEDLEDNITYNDYYQLAQHAINLLPPRRKEIFTLSRFEHKTYAEISDQLNISVNVVENQMAKALKQLKEYMYKHADIGVFCCLLTFM